MFRQGSHPRQEAEDQKMSLSEPNLRLSPVASWLSETVALAESYIFMSVLWECSHSKRKGFYTTCPCQKVRVVIQVQIWCKAQKLCRMTKWTIINPWLMIKNYPVSRRKLFQFLFPDIFPDVDTSKFDGLSVSPMGIVQKKKRRTRWSECGKEGTQCFHLQKVI